MFTTEDILIWMLIQTRVAGLFLMAPVFSHKSIPRTAKVVLASTFAFVVFPFVDLGGVYPNSLIALGLWGAKELAVGLTMGVAIRMIFFILDFASHILTVEIGLRPGPAFDPANAGSHGNPIGTIVYFLGLMILLSGSEYDIFRAFIMSFDVAPLGFFTPNSFAADLFVIKTMDIFTIGILMGAPVLAINFLVNLTFATLGKVVPRLNVFILSFSVRIFLGLSVLAVSVTLIAHYAINYMHDTPEMMLRFIIFRPEL